MYILFSHPVMQIANTPLDAAAAAFKVQSVPN